MNLGLGYLITFTPKGCDMRKVVYTHLQCASFFHMAFLKNKKLLHLFIFSNLLNYLTIDKNNCNDLIGHFKY